MFWNRIHSLVWHWQKLEISTSSQLALIVDVLFKTTVGEIHKLLSPSMQELQMELWGVFITLILLQEGSIGRAKINSR